MIEQIDFVVDPEAEAAGYHKMTTIIDIELADGRMISGRADFGKGSPADPMSYDEVAEKFRRTRPTRNSPPRRRSRWWPWCATSRRCLPMERLMAALTRSA